MAKNYDQEAPEQMWRRSLVRPEVEGEFKSSYDSLLQTLQKNSDVLEKKALDGTNVHASPAYNFGYTDADGHRKNARVFAFVARKRDIFKEVETDVLLAIDPDTADDDLYRLKLSKDGIITNLDDPDANFGETDTEKSLLSAAVGRVSASLSDAHRFNQQRRQERKSKALGWLGGLTAVAVVAGGAGLGVKHWYFDPRARDARARSAYDAEHNVLPGTALPIKTASVTVMPKIDFSKIPKMHGGDNLLSPRTVVAYGNDCAEVKAPFPAGSELVVALPDGDPLVSSTVSVAKSGTNQLEICLTGKDSPDDGKTTDPSRLAVQILR